METNLTQEPRTGGPGHHTFWLSTLDADGRPHMTAVGAWGAARRMGLRIPEDVAIVGYNDIPLASRLVPGLTTVHVPIHEFGSAAARLLLEQIETGDAIRRRVIFNPELIVRGSTVAGADASAGLRPIAAAATE